MRTPALRIMAFSLVLSLPLAAQAPSSADILSRVDENARFSTASYEARLEVTKGKRVSVKAMKALATGDGKSLVEFSNPEDMGIKYLKLKDELWAYFPEENDTVKISGHQLKEGFMGSDLSYEDTLDLDELSGKYEAVLRGTEELEGRIAYVVDLKAIAKGVPYDRRSMWVDAERWIVLKEEMRSKDGTLIKSSRALEAKKIQNRWIVSVLEMKDMRKKDSLTVLRTERMAFDVKIDPKTFWLESLSK